MPEHRETIVRIQRKRASRRRARKMGVGGRPRRPPQRLLVGARARSAASDAERPVRPGRADTEAEEHTSEDGARIVLRAGGGRGAAAERRSALGTGGKRSVGRSNGKKQDGDGALKVAEVTAALEARGVPVPSDLGELWRTVDTDGSGTISLVEFVAATMEPRLYMQPGLCRAAFGLLDADGDGVLTISDLEGFVGDGGKASAILASCRCGRVGYAQFEAMMRAPYNEA